MVTYGAINWTWLGLQGYLDQESNSEPVWTYSSILQVAINAVGRYAQMNLDCNYQKQRIAILSYSQAATIPLTCNTINSISLGMLWKTYLCKESKVAVWWVLGFLETFIKERVKTMLELRKNILRGYITGIVTLGTHGNDRSEIE